MSGMVSEGERRERVFSKYCDEMEDMHRRDRDAGGVQLRHTSQCRARSTGVEPLSEWPLLPRSFQKELGARSSDERTLPPFGGAACPCASAAILPKYAFACDTISKGRF